MRFGAVCVVLSALVIALLGGAQTGRAAVAYRNPTPGAELVYQIPGMHRARVRRNVVYRRVGRVTLKLDVYRPRSASRAARLPAVLLGGPPAFSAGKDSGQKIGWSQLIAASGLAAVAFDVRSDNYLRTPLQPAQDVAAAIAYVRAHAAALGVDRDRLCTLGFSIGTAPWHLWATMREPIPAVRCNVVYYGPLDFQTLRLSLDPKLADEVSALTYLRLHDGKVPPMLIAKAGQDENDGINDSIDRFVAAAQELHADVRLLTHPTGSHGFDLRNDDAQSRSIIAQTLAYFRSHLLTG
jgi:dienelactone hydrolase